MKKWFIRLLILLSVALLLTSCNAPANTVSNQASENVSNEQSPVGQKGSPPPEEEFINYPKADDYEFIDYPTDYRTAFHKSSFGMERGVALVSSSSKYEDLNEFGEWTMIYDYRFTFINEAYCQDEGENGIQINVNKYPIDEAAKFPEDIPAGTVTTYKGKIAWIDTEKNEDGNRIDVLQLWVSSTKSGHPDVLLLAWLYESQVSQDNSIYNFSAGSTVYVTGELLDRGNLYDDNGNAIAVMHIHSIHSNLPIYQAIKDNISEKIYVFHRDAIFVLNFDYSIVKSASWDEFIYPRAAYYWQSRSQELYYYYVTDKFAYFDKELEKTVVGLVNQNTRKIDKWTFEYDSLSETIKMSR